MMTITIIIMTSTIMMIMIRSVIGSYIEQLLLKYYPVRISYELRHRFVFSAQRNQWGQGAVPVSPWYRYTNAAGSCIKDVDTSQPIWVYERHVWQTVGSIDSWHMCHALCCRIFFCSDVPDKKQRKQFIHSARNCNQEEGVFPAGLLGNIYIVYVGDIKSFLYFSSPTALWEFAGHISKYLHPYYMFATNTGY